MKAPLASGGFKRRLDRLYLRYTAGFAGFVLTMAMLEHMGMPKSWIGVTFLLSTVLLYAVIGILSRTTDPVEYYAAGRRVPAFYNGMATAADWMSAASFIGLAGTLYLQGYGGLAFILGWTGGYCLVALLIAPYLRKFGEFTIPDFLGMRYGGHLPRLVGVLAAILCSFVYLVAQIYGVGLITARVTGVDFVIGVFLGLGGVLVCSFLGGMRAVTWTQVAQYIILISAFAVPVTWLSIKQTGNPLPQLAYGEQLAKVTAREAELLQDPKELEVIAAFKAAAAEDSRRLDDVPRALEEQRQAARQLIERLRQEDAPLAAIQSAEKSLLRLPKTEAAAREAWSRAKLANDERARPLAGMPRQAQPFAGDAVGSPEERRAYELSRMNFLALVLCLMVGTAGLPHLLVRCYTTSSVREARRSVCWAVTFIALLYVTAPALAVMVKHEVFNSLVGTPFSALPAWIATWSRVDPSLLSVVDINHDGVLQLGEIRIGGDIIMLATPEIAGLPYVVSGMVAAGGLAAALSTADGLLLTIANALSHDSYFRVVNPKASAARRVALSKVTLLAVALAAAAVAVQRPADIVFLVSAAFSLAAAAFFPALVLGVFWSRANRWGAVAGMLSGLGVTAWYMILNEPWLRQVFRVSVPPALWFGISPIAAGIFGMVAGWLVMMAVSLLTAAPGAAARTYVRQVLRFPHQR